jgi:PBP1b-binding outer membrane lipoprotein LpoB
MLKKISLLMLSVVMLSACESETAAPEASDAAAPAAEVAAPEAPEAAEAPAAPAAEKAGEIGVAQCDEYVTKYRACLSSMSAEAAEASEGGLTMMVDSWKQSLESGVSKDDLGKGCQMASDSAGPQMEAMGCEW